MAFAELATGGDFGLKLVVLAEEQMLSDGNLATGADQALPQIRIAAQLAGKQDFHTSTKKIARGGIAGTERLRLKTSTAAIEAGREDAGVVENDEIVRPEQAREIAELPVVEDPGGRKKVQHARGGAIGQRVLRDQFRRQFVMKIRDPHASRL